MKKFIYSIVLAGAILSCSTDQSNTVPVTYVEAVSNVAKTVADISIDGMTCEMGCVATVKSKLNGLKGISAIHVDFDTDRQIDYAHIEFDKTVVSEQDMISTIQSIGDGVYEVTAVEVIDYKKNETPENDSEMESVSINFQIPSVLQVVDLLLGKI